MYRKSLDFARRGVLVASISAIDIALWDIKGKLLGLSVGELLGGVHRENIVPYATGMYFTDKENPTKDYKIEAEKYLKRAVELMPDDPIVNDHYGDILWKLNRKIQARYFWSNLLKMDDTEKEMIEKINIKIVEGLKSS